MSDQARENLLAALDTFKEFFGDKLEVFERPWSRRVVGWACGFMLDGWFFHIMADTNRVLVPLWLNVDPENTAKSEPCEVSPEEFCRVMKILIKDRSMSKPTTSTQGPT